MSSEDTKALIEAVGLEFRLYQNATDKFDEAAAEFVGLNRTDLRCTDIIERNGRLTAGDLARESGLTTGAITNILDRLAAAGIVRRVRDKEDRRRVYVELTDKAKRRGKEVWGPLVARSRAELGSYTLKELAFIRDFLRRSREFTDKEAARVRSLRRK